MNKGPPNVVVPGLKQLVTGFSQRLLGFKPGPLHMEICDGQSGTGAGFSPRSMLYHVSFIPWILHVHLSQMLCNISNGQCRLITQLQKN
jgi:hypothetical protein